MKFKTREEADIWMVLAAAAVVGQRHDDAASIADRILDQWRERRAVVTEEEDHHRRQFDNIPSQEAL